MGYKINKICPITDSNNKVTYLDLGKIPLVNNLCNTKEEAINATRYPLAVNYFFESGLSMLTAIVDPDELYAHYLYKSGVSQPYIEHCKEMFWFVDNYLYLEKGDKVLDVGGNDGTLLKTFLEAKPYLDVLNVDASENLTKESNEKGVPAYYGYWGVEVAKKLNTKFKLITSTNVFQHTLPINDFVEAIKISLQPKGIWCLEFPYWKSGMETNQYDQIYHEHVYYYWLTPLKLLLEKHGLMMIKVVPYPIHGGSLRVLISHKGEYNPTTAEFWHVCDGVQEALDAEKLLKDDTFISWGKKIKDHIMNCKLELYKLKYISNARIAAFGAAAKGCIFLNTVKPQNIEYVIDDTDLKQGKFIPGVGLEVVSRDILKYEYTKPTHILILAHNFADYIIKSLRKDGYTGKFIVCFPEFKIIE